MPTIRMTQEVMENHSVCRDCRYFHRYRAQHVIRDVYVEEGEVEVESQPHILYRCLLGNAFSPELEEKVIIDCNQFERREEKKKL